MYNGIGLPTARGSGTNGFVQRNLSYIKNVKERLDYKPISREDLDKALLKKPNDELLLHDHKRKLEIKCLEMKILMEDQGFDENEIEEKVSLFRKMLMSSLESVGKSGVYISKDDIEEDALGRPITKNTHQMMRANENKNRVIADAFRISKTYKPGDSFAQMNTTAEKEKLLKLKSSGTETLNEPEKDYPAIQNTADVNVNNLLSQLDAPSDIEVTIMPEDIAKYDSSDSEVPSPPKKSKKKRENDHFETLHTTHKSNNDKMPHHDEQRHRKKRSYESVQKSPDEKPVNVKKNKKEHSPEDYKLSPKQDYQMNNSQKRTYESDQRTQPPEKDACSKKQHKRKHSTKEHRVSSKKDYEMEKYKKQSSSESIEKIHVKKHKKKRSVDHRISSKKDSVADIENYEKRFYESSQKIVELAVSKKQQKREPSPHYLSPKKDYKMDKQKKRSEIDVNPKKHHKREHNSSYNQKNDEKKETFKTKHSTQKSEPTTTKPVEKKHKKRRKRTPSSPSSTSSSASTSDY